MHQNPTGKPDKNKSADKDKADKRDERVPREIRCYHCDQLGHKKPDCPLLKEKDKKMTRVIHAHENEQKEQQDSGIYLTVEMGDSEEKRLSLSANIDSSSDTDIVGKDMVSLLELYGGVRVPLNLEIYWADEDVHVSVDEGIKIRTCILGTSLQFDLTFAIAPWKMSYLIIGSETSRANNLFRQMEDIEILQQKMGLRPESVDFKDNVVVEDINGNSTSIDSMLWPDEDKPPPLTEEDEDDILTPEQREELNRVIAKFSRVFEDKPAGSAKVEPMDIKWKSGWRRPPMGPFRRYSPKIAEALEKENEKMVKDGVVEPSDAVEGCFAHAVPKPDNENGIRFCKDYKPINPGIETESFPLPKVSDILSSLAGAGYFARLDLKKGFWQFLLAVAARKHLAYVVNQRMYQPRVVPMGCVQSSFYLQRTMHKLFGPLIARGVLVYQDDIIIYAATFEEFLRLLEQVLEILQKHDMTLNKDKSAFCQSEVPILGHVVSAKGVRMSEKRKRALDAIRFPKSARELRRFLGITNYMRNFIPNYSMIAKPLTSQVNLPVAMWERDGMQSAFAALKKAVVEQASLAHIDFEVPIFIQTDASTVGIGACLLNRYPDHDRVLGFYSHSFTPAERKWKTIEQECFAIVSAVLHWSPILWGHFFVIETDHRNLTYIHSGTSAKVSRWSLGLQNHTHGTSYRPGEIMYIADPLSRMHAEGKQAHLRCLRLKDFDSAPNCVATAELGAVDSSAPLDSVEAEPLPPSEEDQESAIEPFRWFQKCHNATTGHGGVHLTLRRLKEKGFNWRRMSRDVAEWILQCPDCQKFRLGPNDLQIKSSQIASHAIFEELSIDFIGPLPRDDVGNAYILNAVCDTTLYCELFAVEANTAIIAAHCLLEIVARYGCFKTIRSDRGTHFVNEVIDEFLRIFEIHQILTLAERPQANGICERNGAEVMKHLRILVTPRDFRNIWSVILPLVRRILNNTWRKATGATPHSLIHWAPTNLDRGIFSSFEEPFTMPPLKTEYVARLHEAYELLLDKTSLYICERQRELMKNDNVEEPSTFSPGDYVLVSYLVRPPSKLHARWAGPFQVESVQGNSYSLKDLTGGKPKVVDISRLKFFYVPEGVDVKAIAAADLGESEVAKILSHKGNARNRKELQFEVEWSDGDITWESWESVKRLKLIDDYIHSNSSLKALKK